ncbi:MAG: phosphohistidine phosphatase SixA [Leptolyngbyaceae bacterium]|nr:phosphohistidine phosphatase SixA [Leptolyngbyaceae bacterium]
MTLVYFFRHGIAAERGTYANDGDRPLTDKGIAKTQRVVQRCHDLGIRADLILSSPFVRARQTADILTSIGVAPAMTLSDDLAPDGSIHSWLEWLKHWQPGQQDAVILVGHQPDLGRWAEQLVWGEITDRLVVKKAGIIGVEVPKADPPIGKSELFWLTPPRYFLEP